MGDDGLSSSGAFDIAGEDSDSSNSGNSENSSSDHGEDSKSGGSEGSVGRSECRMESGVVATNRDRDGNEWETGEGDRELKEGERDTKCIGDERELCE